MIGLETKSNLSTTLHFSISFSMESVSIFFFFFRFLSFRISVSLKCVYQLSVWLLRKCRKVKENEKKKNRNFHVVHLFTLCAILDAFVENF